MLPEYFLYVSAAILFASGVSYLVATLRGDAQPNRVTWFFWGLAPMIAAIAALSKGVGLATLPVFVNGAMPLLIFLASFINKKAYWKISPFDYSCGAMELMALLLWYLTTDATIAIIFSILVGLCASTPTVLKAYKYPETEDGLAFILGTISMLVGFLAVQQYSFDSAPFLGMATLVNAVITFGIYRRKIFTSKVQK